MPEICVFHGIKIVMYTRDHNPPHFHARFAGVSVSIDIETLNIIKGDIYLLSNKRRRELMAWATEHRDELRLDWYLVSNGMLPHKIDPPEGSSP